MMWELTAGDGLQTGLRTCGGMLVICIEVVSPMGTMALMLWSSNVYAEVRGKVLQSVRDVRWDFGD